MDILTNAYGYGPVRVGSERTISDMELWKWLQLCIVYESAFKTGEFHLWSDLAGHKYQTILSEPSFHNDSLNFCKELIDFSASNSITDQSGLLQRRIDFAKNFYHRRIRDESNGN